MLNSIDIHSGPPRLPGGIRSVFTQATDAQGRGVAGGPLDGFVFQRSVGDTRKSWADGVKATMTGCGCAGAHDHGCAAEPDPCGGWVVAPAEGEEGEGAIVPPDQVRTKHAICNAETRTFRSFTIYYPEEFCSTDPVAVMEGRADAGLDSYCGYLLGHELATGYHTGNPSLQSEADDITQAAVSVCSGIGGLLDGWYDKGMPGTPVISGRPGVIAVAGKDWGAQVQPFGVPLLGGVPGASPGSQYFPPWSDPGTHDGTASESSLYLHGPGFYALSPVRHPKIDEDRAEESSFYEYLWSRYNRGTIVAEQTALVVWHTCCAIAQRVKGNC